MSYTMLLKLHVTRRQCTI